MRCFSSATLSLSAVSSSFFFFFFHSFNLGCFFLGTGGSTSSISGVSFSGTPFIQAYPPSNKAPGRTSAAVKAAPIFESSCFTALASLLVVTLVSSDDVVLASCSVNAVAVSSSLRPNQLKPPLFFVSSSTLILVSTALVSSVKVVLVPSSVKVVVVSSSVKAVLVSSSYAVSVSTSSDVDLPKPNQLKPPPSFLTASSCSTLTLLSIVLVSSSDFILRRLSQPLFVLACVAHSPKPPSLFVSSVATV